MFFLAVNIIKKNCVIGKQGFSLFPFFVLGIVPIFANDNYTLTGVRLIDKHLQKTNMCMPMEELYMLEMNLSPEASATETLYQQKELLPSTEWGRLAV